MTVLYLLILLASGIGIGFISGLLGVGGGIIMTPVQYWVYTSAGMSPDIAIKISVATSLAVILPTAASGVWQHHKLGSINWRAAIYMGIFTAIGGFIGAIIASHISGTIIKLIFGSVTILAALRMVTIKISDENRPTSNTMWLWIALALPIGILTGILGIGGGLVVVPVLVLALHFRMRNAAGTSLAMMLFTSTGGILGYILSGTNGLEVPAFSTGFIYWPAWLALSISCIPMAQVGAIVAHKVHGQKLTYLFVALLFYIGLDMLGVINWIVSKF